MKFILTFLMLAFPCLLFAQGNNSTYDKDGKVKSIEQRRFDESQNKPSTVTTSSYTGNHATSASYRKKVRKALKERRMTIRDRKRKLKDIDRKENAANKRRRKG